VQTHGRASEQLGGACEELAIPLHAFAWSRAAGEAGFRRDAAYLVRPDGYVAMAAVPSAAAEQLRRAARLIFA
jgi:hypothetical protein